MSFFLWLELKEIGDQNQFVLPAVQYFKNIHYFNRSTRFLLQNKFNFLLIIFTLCQWEATSL